MEEPSSQQQNQQPQAAGPISSPGIYSTYAPMTESYPGLKSSSTEPTSEPLTASTPFHRGGMTIRAVTPEPDAEAHENEMNDPDAQTLVSATPPRTPSRSTFRPASKWEPLGRSSPEPTLPMSPENFRCAFFRNTAQQLADLATNRAKSRSPTERMRSMTLTDDMDRPPPHAPPLPPRLSGDIDSPPVPSYTMKHRESSPASMGFPWSQSPPILTQPLTKVESNKSRRLLRTQGSSNKLQKGTQDQRVVPPINVEYSALVHLMKIVQGQMEGYADYRLSGIMTTTHQPWTNGYCYIDIETGSFMYQKEENRNTPGTAILLLSDIRGCQVRPSADDPESVIEVITHSKKAKLMLRPLNVQHFDYWLAALLCWRPIRPAGMRNRLIRQYPNIIVKEKRRRNSDATVQNRGDVSLIKVGRMMLWSPDRPILSGERSKSSNKNKYSQVSMVHWQNVSCMLEDSGEFRLQKENANTPMKVLQLSQMGRCAIQLLDASILDQEFCIAIYPQYSYVLDGAQDPSPVYLSVDRKEAFEAWFVLLRAFTLPELYGPSLPSPSPPPSSQDAPSSSSSDSVPPLKSTPPTSKPLEDTYRIHRSVYVRVVEAKLNVGYYPSGHEREPPDCYAEVNLDGELRAKTMVRTKTRTPFWREDYEFSDLPTAITDVEIVLKRLDPKEAREREKAKRSGTVIGSAGFGGGLGGMSLPGSHDPVIGHVKATVDRLKEDGSRIEGWIPLTSVIKEGVEERIGEIYAKIEIEELTVLMSDEYQPLLTALHDFDSNLTLHLTKVMTDLKRLADTLLQIFHVSDKVDAWLMRLAEHEIDGIHQEATAAGNGSAKTQASSSQVDSDQQSTTSGSTAQSSTNEAPEGRSLVDANILFRGNTLLTKALDTYMKKLGREYLEETIGSHLRRIVEDDLYCEVDPSRLEDNRHGDYESKETKELVSKNWKALLGITKGIWKAIYESPHKCPLEMRKILRHIRSQVVKRYGGTKGISYSCVCGFLFLRFFCPAILNPKLFGLLKDHPGQRAQRTLTLVAKALQGLANMTTLGIKESFMAPANEFLTSHSSELQRFIDSITTIPPLLERAVRTTPPAYATPRAIRNRLEPQCREGWLSLPGLVDRERACAALVRMWMRYTTPTTPLNKHIRDPTAPTPPPIPSSPGPATNTTSSSRTKEVRPELKEFDAMCKELHRKSELCLASAAPADCPSSSWERRWEEIAEEATRPVLLTTTSSGTSANGIPGTAGTSAERGGRPGTAGAPCVPHGPSATSSSPWSSIPHTTTTTTTTNSTSSSSDSRGSSRDSMGLVGVNAAMRGIVTSTTSVITSTSSSSALTSTAGGSTMSGWNGGASGRGSEERDRDVVGDDGSDLYGNQPCAAFRYNVAEDGRWGVVTTAVAYAGGKEPRGVGGAVRSGFGLWKKGGKGKD